VGVVFFLRHAVTLWRTVVGFFFDGYAMAPGADQNFAGEKMNTRALGFVVLFGCLMAGGPLQAHHSTASIYDPGKQEEITGTLAKLQFVNPHGSITVTVSNTDGTTTDWTFTTGSATALANQGITKVGPNALKLGEELTVTFVPARNGSPLGGLKSIKRADGQVLGNEGGN
jgi:hypothetical protein